MMNLSPRYIVFFIALLGLMLGWNAFIIQRDQKLFKLYYHESAKEQYCASLKTWHPDCKIE